MILAIEPYLKANIDDRVTITQWGNKNKLPTIDIIEKHIKRIKELTNKKIVLYYREITRYRRKSLIEIVANTTKIAEIMNFQ